ncbi:extracellular solute-binding protein, partial [bacterium]|nr:extracellular solute-binding protein [bacterium]
RLEPRLIQEARSLDGHTYQMPWKTNPIMICYNKKLLRQAGYETFPTTYSGFFDAAEKITADLNGDGYIDRWMGISDIRVTWWQRFFDFYALYIAASNGNTLVKGKEVLFENDAAEQVFTFLQTNFKKGYFPKEKTAGRTDIFLQDVVATRFTGPWTIMHNDKFKPEGFEYDFAPLPRPDNMAHGPAFTYGDFKNIVIFSTTKHQEAAWEFVKFIVSQKGDQQLLEITNQLPLRRDLASDSSFADYFRQNPRMKIFANQAKTVRGVDMSPILKEVFDAISQEYETAVVYGVRTPKEAVKRAAKRVRLILQ